MSVGFFCTKVLPGVSVCSSAGFTHTMMPAVSLVTIVCAQLSLESPPSPSSVQLASSRPSVSPSFITRSSSYKRSSRSILWIPSPRTRSHCVLRDDDLHLVTMIYSSTPSAVIASIVPSRRGKAVIPSLRLCISLPFRSCGTSLVSTKVLIPNFVSVRVCGAP